MIKLTRVDDSVIAINEEFIENVTEAPDTIIMLQNGRSYVVKEKINEIIALTIEFKQKCVKQFYKEK